MRIPPGSTWCSRGWCTFQPTENGTLYAKAELEAIRQVCREYGLWLFVDGARCGYGLVAPGNDVGLKELAALCDVFYIGGTKVGALLGEAVVITAPALNKEPATTSSVTGGMLAKGRLGIQFETLMEDGCYEAIAAHGGAGVENSPGL